MPNRPDKDDSKSTEETTVSSEILQGGKGQGIASSGPSNKSAYNGGIIGAGPSSAGGVNFADGAATPTQAPGVADPETTPGGRDMSDFEKSVGGPSADDPMDDKNSGLHGPELPGEGEGNGIEPPGDGKGGGFGDVGDPEGPTGPGDGDENEEGEESEGEGDGEEEGEEGDPHEDSEKDAKEHENAPGYVPLDQSQGKEGEEGEEGGAEGKRGHVGDGLTSGTEKPTVGDAAKTAARRAIIGTGLEMGKEIGKDVAKDLASHGRKAVKKNGARGFKNLATHAAKGATKKAVKKTAKRTLFKWIFGFGLPSFGLMWILFLLLLFQSVHIKHIFIDYEFAKFNRAFSRRLEKAASRAKAISKGSAATTVDAAADPEEQLKGANEEEMKKLADNPDALADEVELAEKFEQSSEGPTQETLTDAGVGDRYVDPVDELKASTDAGGAAPEKPVDEALKKVTDTIEGKPAPIDAVPDVLKESVKEAQDAAAAGKTPAEIRDISLKGFAKISSGFVGKATGPLIILTFGCIARDIYVSSQKLFAKIKLDALMRVAATTAKVADCRQEGKCGTAYEAALDSMYSTATESFTNTAGYQRATSQPVTQAGTDHDLQPAMEPVNPGGTGVMGELMNILNKVANIPGFGETCSVVLNPWFQGIATVGIIATQVIAAITGVADFGLSDVVVAAVATGASILATKIGTSLAIDAVLQYSGLLFRGPFTPTQMGNMTDAGAKAIGSDTCRRSGCHQLSAAENTQLTEAIRHDQIEYAHKQGIAYELFSQENPLSVAGLVADQIPVHPASMLTKMNTAVASILTPSRFMQFFATLVTSRPYATALAVESRTYNLPDYGIPDQQTGQYDTIENSRWVKTHVDEATKTKLEACSTVPYSDILTSHDYDYCNENSEMNIRYGVFKMDQRATHALVVLNNQQEK